MADIFALTREALAGLDLELVDVERAPLGLLRITIDRPEGVRIEDCELVSRQLSRVFDVENIDYKRRSEEHTSELQSLMRISYAVFCLKKKKRETYNNHTTALTLTQTHNKKD